MIDDVDNEAFKKAVIKRDVRREQDISGHLLGTKEAEDKANGKNSGDPTAWWNQKDKSSKNLSPRDKILAEDFQVLQAYNYLKAWKVMRNFGIPEASASGPNAAAQPAQTSPAKSAAEQPTAVKPSKNEVLKMKKQAPKKLLVPPGKGVKPAATPAATPAP